MRLSDLIEEYIKDLMNDNDEYTEFITQQDADIIINNLVNYGVTNADVAKIMRVAVNDKVLSLPIEYKDATRSRILKNMLLNLV